MYGQEWMLCWFFAGLSRDLIHSCLLSLDSIRRKCLYRPTTWDKGLIPCCNPMHLRSSFFLIFAYIFLDIIYLPVFIRLFCFLQSIRNPLARGFFFFSSHSGGQSYLVPFLPGFFKLTYSSNIWIAFLLHNFFLHTATLSHLVLLSLQKACSDVL